MALAEGLVFAETLGLDKATFLGVARKSAAYSQIMDIKGGKMVEGDFSPVSKVSQHLKDVHTMLAYAARHGQSATVSVRCLPRCSRPASATATASATMPSPSRKSAAARRPR